MPLRRLLVVGGEHALSSLDKPKWLTGSHWLVRPATTVQLCVKSLSCVRRLGDGLSAAVGVVV